MGCSHFTNFFLPLLRSFFYVRYMSQRRRRILLFTALHIYIQYIKMAAVGTRYFILPYLFFSFLKLQNLRTRNFHYYNFFNKEHWIKGKKDDIQTKIPGPKIRYLLTFWVFEAAAPPRIRINQFLFHRKILCRRTPFTAKKNPWKILTKRNYF